MANEGSGDLFGREHTLSPDHQSEGHVPRGNDSGHFLRKQELPSTPAPARGSSCFGCKASQKHTAVPRERLKVRFMLHVGTRDEANACLFTFFDLPYRETEFVLAGNP